MQILKFTGKLFPDWVRWLSSIPDYRVQKRCRFSLEQVLFCGLMLFILRHRSLRAFVLETRGSPKAIENFGKGITISEVPSDDDLRYCLSTVSLRSMNGLLKCFHNQIERRKLLSNEKLFGRLELVALDGTGQISSSNIHCEKCLTRKQETGGILYLHGQLLASLTNTKATYALPLQFEPIERSDTETEYTKNDCELNAAKRLIQKMKTDFPKRSFCFLGDNLFAVEPFVSLILQKGWHFIFTAKPERNKELFYMFDYVYEKKKTLSLVDQKGHLHVYSWSNKLPIKKANFKEPVLHVNLLTEEEIDADGVLVYRGAWITDFAIDAGSVKALAQAGRARFAIENRNFNEQKKSGFHTEHNFGHFGNLPNVFFGLAQVAQLITELFRFWVPAKEWIETVGSKRRYFERLAVLVTEMIIEDSGLSILYLKFDFNTS